ncbi:MAG: cupin domain-containing protein [Prolixibacteraceae bacterium]|jgi:uncharacterized cupin superfamily protein
MATFINPKELQYQNNPAAPSQFDLLTLSPRLMKITDSKQLIFDIRQLNPDKYSFPYHYHHNSEELMYVISGEMTVRTPEGLRIIGPGELVFFELGETSAHQFFNHSDTPCVYLDIRTNMGIDVTEYPDSGKVNVFPFGMIFEKDTQVTYHKGEENVEAVWANLKKNNPAGEE